MRHLDQRKRSCVRVRGPRKLNVAVFKGFYDTHTQPVSVSYKHAKRCVRSVYIRKQGLAYFSYAEMLTRMRVLHKDEICFTSMDAILKQL